MPKTFLMHCNALEVCLFYTEPSLISGAGEPVFLYYYDYYFYYYFFFCVNNCVDIIVYTEDYVMLYKFLKRYKSNIA